MSITTFPARGLNKMAPTEAERMRPAFAAGDEAEAAGPQLQSAEDDADRDGSAAPRLGLGQSLGLGLADDEPEPSKI